MAIIYESVLSLKQANKLAWRLKIRDHVPVLMMILSVPDSAPRISPWIPRICLTFAPALGIFMTVNVWLFGSNLTNAFEPKSVNHTHLFDLQIQHMALDFHLAVSILSIYCFEIVHYKIVIISFINPQLSLHLDQGLVAQLL